MSSALMTSEPLIKKFDYVESTDLRSRKVQFEDLKYLDDDEIEQELMKEEDLASDRAEKRHQRVLKQQKLMEMRKARA